LLGRPTSAGRTQRRCPAAGVQRLPRQLEPPSGGRAINATVAGGVSTWRRICERDRPEPEFDRRRRRRRHRCVAVRLSLFHDEPTIEAMNAMRLAVSSVGNHEFDEGLPSSCA
jgi:5'-nucleotidase